MSNRSAYTLIAFLVLSVLGVGVYAFTGNVGHTSDQIDEVDPTVLESVKDGVDWTELLDTGTVPAGFADGIDDVGSRGLISCSIITEGGGSIANGLTLSSMPPVWSEYSSGDNIECSGWVILVLII